MIIVGLTGSVASGKSTVAGWMRESGIAVHDADAAVHSLLAANGQAVGKYCHIWTDIEHLMGSTAKNLADMCLPIQLIEKTGINIASAGTAIS